MGRDADILVLLYDNPGHSGMSVLARALSGIVAEAPDAAGAKHSDGDLTQTFDYARLSPGLRAFVGRDTAILPTLRGCAGAVL